jgi:hypothetical protein
MRDIAQQSGGAVMIVIDVATGSRRYEYVEPGGRLVKVMRMKANLARMVVAIFTMAMLYASLCSASCEVGVCPEQTQRTAGHDCDQMPSHHSGSSGRQTPGKPDCPQHQHPDLFVAKSGGDLPQFQLNIPDHLHASATTFLAQYGLPAILSRTEASEHAPPVVSSVPFYNRISVLRI